MGFWVFVLICLCLIPVSMIVFGAVFRRGYPRTPNALFGYRTRRSMQSEDAWQFAHQYIGRLWFWLGWILLVPSCILMLLLRGTTDDSVGTALGLLMIPQMAVLILPILPTEHQLKKQFDEEGRRR